MLGRSFVGEVGSGVPLHSGVTTDGDSVLSSLENLEEGILDIFYHTQMMNDGGDGFLALV